MRVLIGCERFGRVREAFLELGHDAWSCDIEESFPPSNRHIKGDVREVLGEGWDFAIFHPDCTYLTNSAAWAYQDPDYDRYPRVGYRQKIKPGTLVGEARRQARQRAVEFVYDLRDAPIPRKVVENPCGYLSTVWRIPDQTIQPNQFGDDASKATCLWFEGDVPPLVPTKQIEPRWVNGLPRWANQTDTGQNRLSPADGRAMERAATYPGIATAFAIQWGSLDGGAGG